MSEAERPEDNSERMQQLVRSAFAMAFPNEPYPGFTSALAAMVAALECSREAVASVSVVLRETRKDL